jgi:hypothetical protein
MIRFEDWCGPPLAAVVFLTLGNQQALAEQPRKEPPAQVDLTRWQTLIGNQGGRDTCIYHPQIAALEAEFRGGGGGDHAGDLHSGKEGPNAGPALDNVRVVAVPARKGR